MTAEVVPWPIPGDSELDKARRVARDYRNELHRIAPEQCARMDEQARRLGQGWVTPQIAHVDLDDFVRAADLSEMVGVSRDVIYQWAHRGHIARYRDDSGRTVYLVREVVEYHAALRQGRVSRHAKGQSGRRAS